MVNVRHNNRLAMGAHSSRGMIGCTCVSDSIRSLLNRRIDCASGFSTISPGYYIRSGGEQEQFIDTGIAEICRITQALRALVTPLGGAVSSANDLDQCPLNNRAE